jgi:hypothetical protein
LNLYLSSIVLDRIGATVLSHHTDDFTLVSAFLLFSMGCLNAVLGLVFRESAKTKRSILHWREEAKTILPFDKRPVFTSPAPSFVSSMFKGEKANEAEFGSGQNNGSNPTSFGFGRKGERTAGLKGALFGIPVRGTQTDSGLMIHRVPHFETCRVSPPVCSETR